MGSKSLGLTFWGGFEKAAGSAIDRLKRIRSVAPHAFKPTPLLGQIVSNPAKGLANAAVRHSAASAKEAPMRWASRAVLGTAGLVAAANHIGGKDPDYNRRTM